MPKSEKILLVDDDQDDRLLMMEAFLETETLLEVVELENGDKLLKYLEREEPPKFIVMDFHMERLSGEDLLMTLKKTKQYSRIPVIVYSGSSPSIQKDPVLESGANAYVQKPGSFKEMVEIVKSMVLLFG